MKNQNTEVNYRTFTRNVQLLIDESFAERVIPANDSVRLLDQLVEETDLAPLERALKRNGRKHRTNPVTMLKIILYSAMERQYTSRTIEDACKRDINYIWLLDGEPAPNQRAICRFRSEVLSQCSEELFYGLVKKMVAVGEINYGHLFVDGTKIEANANKYSFVWQKSTNKYESRVSAKLEKLVPLLCNQYGILAEDGEALLEQLRIRCGVMVHGRGKHKSQVQRDIENMESLLACRAKYGAYQETFRGRNSFSKTDKDATFMHMKDDHMRNAQLKPGYNIQFAVEGEYITGALVSSERSDQLTLIPLLEKMEQQLGTTYDDVTCDAGYESEENYTYFEGKPTECYIKPQNYERSKTKKFKSNMALRENMEYDITLDEYTCQNGKKIRAVYEGKRKSKSGFESMATYYECEDCTDCPHKKNCTKSNGNRKMQVSKTFVRQRQESLARITSPTGILLRMNRSIQSEGAFGVVKWDYGFQRFLHRGNKKVLSEILLVAMGYNINKYHNKLQQNRTGRQLHEKLTA